MSDPPDPSAVSRVSLSPSSSLRRKPPPPPLQRSASFSSQISSGNGSPLLVDSHSPEYDRCSCLNCADRVPEHAEDKLLSSRQDSFDTMDPTASSSRSVTFDMDATTPLANAGRLGSMTHNSGRPRSNSRQRNDASTSNLGATSVSPSHASGPAGPVASGSGSGRSNNIPLPSPSAVHINQSLEESLRRAEEERQRRSSERRQLRRKRKQGSGKSSGNPAKGRAPNIEEEPEQEEDDAQAKLPKSLSPALVSDEAESGGEGEADSASDMGSGDGDYLDSELEDENGRSLTRQLAETAVSVREMSRELGRARVKSTIQSVLIVTKARDNQLIKLTRELALYLMKTPRYGRNKGLVVYVDAQLKKSKRFDAAGIERDNPDLFRSNHHHHHHPHTREGSVSSSQGHHVRRGSTRRPSSTSTSSLNLLGMTSTSGTGHSSSTSTSAVSGISTAPTSGSSTPALASSTSLANGRPLTKLTEALVNRQLERENQRRQNSTSGYNSSSTANGEHAPSGSGTQTPMSPNHHIGSSNSGREKDADEQQGQLRYWTAEMCSKSPHLFDLVVTLGGDGTVLFTSWLFQHVVPPVIPFALGSLGFLTNFDFSNYRRVMDTAINDGVRVNLRMRFTATIYRAVDEEAETESRRRVVRSGETGQIFMEKLRSGGWDAIEAAPNAPTAGANGAGSQTGQGKCHRDRELRCSVTRPVESFEVLNDLVVDRGPSPYVSQLELFGDEHHMTTVQADGLCVATPTGSTAYSLSAGGSLVHPEIPTLLITPICPHTLSFRPMLLPDSMELRICVPYNSRSTAWASFDGRGRVELKQGDHIKVTASQYPFPTVCADKQSTDWFQAITRTLKWNERQRQKSFVVVEHDRQKPASTATSKEIAEKDYTANVNTGEKLVPSKDATAGASAVPPEEEEDDGTFDIDDIPVTSGTTSPDKSDGTGGENEAQSTSGTASANKPSASSSSSAPEQQQQQQREQSYSQAEQSNPHLREYNTSSRPGITRNRESRERTPRSSELPGINTSEPSLRTPRPSQRRHSTSPRPVGSSRHAQGDKVKAFVVFGADSSDNDTSASEDGY